MHPSGRFLRLEGAGLSGQIQPDQFVHFDSPLLHEITAALILYIQEELGIAGLIPNPELRFLPQQQLEQLACDGGGCSNIYGWFSYEDSVVYMTLDNDVYHNLYDRSVLLHELVHYIQDHQGILQSGNNACSVWKTREVQAYEIQYQWLRRNRIPIRAPSYNTRLAQFESIDCATAPETGSASYPDIP